VQAGAVLGRADSLHPGGQAEACPEPSNNRDRQQRTQQTLTDGLSQVKHAAALLIRIATRLRDEEANASSIRCRADVTAVREPAVGHGDLYLVLRGA
jgi:hypothetical protein